MYQIKAQNGYEIQVLGKGERAPCRIQRGRDSAIVFEGTYAECERWLDDRGLSVLMKAEGDSDD